MSAALESKLMSHAYGLETLKTEFVEIINADRPEIDKALDACILLGQAIEQFTSLIDSVKQEAAALVPDPKDEVIVGRARVVHRIVNNKRLDKEAWAAAVDADESLARKEVVYLEAKGAYDKAQAPFKLASSWIEIKEAK